MLIVAVELHSYKHSSSLLAIFSRLNATTSRMTSNESTSVALGYSYLTSLGLISSMPASRWMGTCFSRYY